MNGRNAQFPANYFNTPAMGFQVNIPENTGVNPFFF